MPPAKKATKARKASKRKSSASSEPKASKPKGEGTNVRKFRRPDGSTQLVVPGVEGSELSDLPDGASEIDPGPTP